MDSPVPHDGPGGPGSAFRFEIPLAAAAGAEPPTAPVGLAGRRALLADPSPSRRRHLAALLERWGMELEAAPDADALLARLRAAGPAPELVIVDDGFDGGAGEKVPERLRREAVAWQAPLLLLTPLRRRAADARLAQLGFAARIDKPLRTEALARSLCAHLAVGGGATAAAARPALAPTTAPASHILLGEDNAMNRMLTRKLLERRGYRVTEAEDGRRVLDALDGGETFDLLLLDIQMPVMCGFEVVEKLRAREAESGGPRLPVVALTASAMAGDRERCLAAGMDDHVVKPVEIGTLYAAISAHIGDGGTA